MKNTLTQIIRLLVGALFIFSGFVKLVDPLGSAYKFEEYFGADVLNLEFLIPYALPFSIFLIIVEIMLGVMLLVGYKSKFTVWSLLAIISLFLFLTFYSAYFDKVRDCGCFGDAIKLSAWETFYKNVVFIVLILWLVVNVKNIRPLYSRKLSGAISTLFLLIFGFITYHVLNHLPIKDFRPYAVGKNIPEQMIYPEGAKEDVYDITFIYKVDGVEKEFAESEKPWEIAGAEFVDRKTVLVEKGYEPPIHDFTMERNGIDLTERLMKKEKLMLIVAYNLSKSNMAGFTNIKTVTDKALENGYTVYMMSASPEEEFEEIKEEYELDFNLLYCDETTLKTIIRSSPGIVTVNNGTVVGKWSFNDFEKVTIKEGERVMKKELTEALKKSLDSLFMQDKKYRMVMNAESPKKRDSIMAMFSIPLDSVGADFWLKQSKIDSTNMQFLGKVIDEYGYIGASLIGQELKDSAAEIILHSNSIDTYIEEIREAAKHKELTLTVAATMEDLYLMNKGEDQIYGTQTAYIDDKYVIWPIKDVENVNERRSKAGFKLTLQEYAKELFGEGYMFKPE